VTFSTSVRRAVSDDAHILADIERMARDGIAGARGSAALLEGRPAVGPRWADRIIDPDAIVLLALIDDVPVGFLEASSTVGEQVALIDQVFVEPGAREIGLGELLVEAVTTLSIERGHRRIDALALPGDRETKNLYERVGMTARLITVSRTLTDERQ
jgi:GNAT superfamily N-acetyltransferase